VNVKTHHAACLVLVLVGCAAQPAPEPARHASPVEPALSPASGQNAVPRKPEPWHAPGSSLPGVDARCTEWASIEIGPYKYENDTWGSKKAQGKWEQCVLKREVDGKTELGWTWNWPGNDPSIFAYPEIIFGWKPWSGGKPSDPRFPLRVSDVRKLSLHYEVETEASGSYNLAPEIWLIENTEWSELANPKLITTEVMFWMDYAGTAQPAGKLVDTLVVDGSKFELWKEDKMGVEANGKGWMLLSFKSATIQRKGTLNIHAFLAELVTRKLVKPDERVASIEFGNEIAGGSGTTWVKHYAIEVAP
jgi:hypothetical protein